MLQPGRALQPVRQPLLVEFRHALLQNTALSCAAVRSCMWLRASFLELAGPAEPGQAHFL